MQGGEGQEVVVEEEDEDEEEAVGGGGRRRGTRSAPRPLRPLPSLSPALFSQTSGRRLGFVRGDGVAPRPPKEEPDTCLAARSCVPAPGAETPSARASRVSRLLGKPRRRRHHE